MTDAAASAPHASLLRRLDLPEAGLPIFALFVGLATSLNLLIVCYVPYGVLIELALLLWAGILDPVAFNGKGRAFVAFRRGWWWKAFQSYFPVSLRQEEDFDADKRYLFVIHPHGIIGIGAWLAFAADCAGLSRKNHDLDIGIATVNLNFYLPFWRDILLAVGFLDASFKSLQSGLRRNRSVAVVLGGAAEALYAHPGTNDIILNKRKGIVRLALTTGTPMVPVFMFGESELYYQVANPKGSLLRSIQQSFLRVFKFSPPVPVGVGVLGCPIGVMPRRVPLHIVTGKPIPVPLIETPSERDILKYQAIYRTALEALYATHEERYYGEILPPSLRPAVRPKLRIVE
ncbi:hypothetical protein Poli38472_005047 [Pythium oligandrum]|uniref:Acyltransferase n=1 Tax=Pythium oligandrum TaxID=41045 RepID=A0A8K1FIU5_PYTOL|nr:hypothetical protein Poli38472_005047 [Pythium oligandrum]|eukprot:TMW62429.1 hypothetical protein Poli38472_005047 [Pythium oligandrum]